MLLGMLVSVLVHSLNKWKSPLAVVVILEMGSLLVLATFYGVAALMASPLMVILVFLVGEALILLSAFYSSLQWSGISRGEINLN